MSGKHKFPPQVLSPISVQVHMRAAHENHESKVGLADIRRSRCAPEHVALLVRLTGLSLRRVESHLRAAHGNTRVDKVFATEWPTEKAPPMRLRVASARAALLDVELSEATGLRLAEVVNAWSRRRPGAGWSACFPSFIAPWNAAERSCG